MALACACAGIIIGVVTLTGLGITFTQWVVGLSQNTLLLALVLTTIAGIMLGMGMPTTPAYIIMVSLLVPAMIRLGVSKPAAHMFAFYFAILSAITPPVALAVYAAAGLAKSDIWTTGWAAVRIGAAGFIVPFMFVYEPALLMIGDWPTIIWSLGHGDDRLRAARRRPARLSAAAEHDVAERGAGDRRAAAGQARPRDRHRRRGAGGDRHRSQVGAPCGGGDGVEQVQ